MNTDNVLFNLHEAEQELKLAIEAASADDIGPFMVHMAFTFRKLNRAWNSRNMTTSELLSQSSEQRELHSGFPRDLPDLISDSPET